MMIRCMPHMVIALLFLAACSDTQHKSHVIARIGDTSITGLEFQRDFEQGFPELKRGADPRASYLEHMIDERLLAMEGYRIGIDSLSSVQRRIKSLTNELLVGKIFDEDAARSVHVKPSDIDSLRRLDAIRFALRFIPAPDSEIADNVRKRYVDEGFDAALAMTVAVSGDGLSLPSASLETGLLSAADLDPAVWEAIRTLPVGAVSEPIAYRNSFLLVEVIDIVRTPITAEPSPEALERYHQIVYAEQSQKAARSLIQRTVADSNLRLKGSVYGRLERALWQWLNYREVEPKSDYLTLGAQLATDSSSFANSLRELGPETVIQTNERSWSVAEFLDEYPHDRYPVSTRSFEEFRSDFYDAFGLLVRDRIFIRLAIELGFDTDPSLQTEVRRWSDKWTYQAYRSLIADSVSVGEDDILVYFERYRSNWPDASSLEDVRLEVERQVRHAKMRAVLEDILVELRSTTRIEIDHDALGMLTIPSTGVSSAPTQLFKASTGRPAWPVTDYGL
jgi:hypothetical protein